MKKISCIIAVLFLCFSYSCTNSSKVRLKSEIDSVVMNIQRAKENSSSMILILDLNSNRIIICNSRIETPEPPPPPPGIRENDSESNLKKIDSEVIMLSEKETNKMKKLLGYFEKEDYENKNKPSIDGIGISLTFIWTNNQIKEVDLINDSTKNQIKFFKSLFEILLRKSKNSEYIINVYP